MSEEVNPWADSPEEKEMTIKSTEIGKIVRLKLEQGETVVRIVGAYKVFKEHWFQSVKRTAVCPGKDCPMCSHPDKAKLFEQAKAIKEKGGEENKKKANVVFKKAYAFDPKVKYVVNVIDKSSDMPAMKVWLFSRTIKETIMKFAERYGDPTGYDLIINRTGTKLETKYTVIAERESVPLTASEKGLKTFNLHNIFKPAPVERVLSFMKGIVPEKTASKTPESKEPVSVPEDAVEDQSIDNGLDDALDKLGDIG